MLSSAITDPGMTDDNMMIVPRGSCSAGGRERRDVRENALHRGFAPTAAALAGITELATAVVA